MIIIYSRILSAGNSASEHASEAIAAKAIAQAIFRHEKTENKNKYEENE